MFILISQKFCFDFYRECLILFAKNKLFIWIKKKKFTIFGSSKAKRFLKYLVLLPSSSHHKVLKLYYLLSIFKILPILHIQNWNVHKIIIGAHRCDSLFYKHFLSFFDDQFKDRTLSFFIVHYLLVQKYVKQISSKNNH